MYRQKIGISLANKHDIPTEEALKIIKRAGFDAVSPAWNRGEELTRVAKIAKDEGLKIQSLHAPTERAYDMWERDDSLSGPVKEELFAALDACASLGIPVMVVHAWIGFGYKFDKESLYFGKFDELVNKAKRCGVRIAFENTEGLEYLEALMEHFEGNDSVGYCWDSGHEMCYNFSEDLLARWGDRLIMTHINDNLGTRSYDGVIWWTDDLHLLPYDGIGDWELNVERLKRAKPIDILNFEVKIESKPDSHENDMYMKMTPEEYYAEAYKRAARIAYRYSR